MTVLHGVVAAFGKHVLALVVVASVSATGCSRVQRRFSLEGAVTVDGMPLESGAIAWLPDARTGGPSCGGSITKGRFSIPPREGAREGTYRVEITASRASERVDFVEADGTKVYLYSQYLPARYNSDSELVATVTSGGRNVYTFDLTTKNSAGRQK